MAGSPRADVVDVAVVGGGPAGVAAAIGAARLGARTLLVEQSERLGGNATNAFVHTICGLYLPASEAGPRLAHPGFPAHFAARLARRGGAGEPERAGRVDVLPTEPDVMARVFAETCRAAATLDTWSSAVLRGAVLARAGEASSQLVVERRGEVREVTAALLVDTSGDAVLGAVGGADTLEAEPGELQCPSYIFRLDGVETDALRGFGRLRLAHAVAGAARLGVLPAGCDSVLARPGLVAGQAYVTLNVPKPEGDAYRPLDPGALAALAKRARESAERVLGFLRATRAEFAGARLSAWPARLGVRETRRLAGRVVLEKRAVLAGCRRDDEVALSTWPIELWNDHRRAHFEYPLGPSSIPLGALVSRSHPRLAMAGRCLSASHEALGALRVIGTAMATGEAAGVAAAVAADRGCELSAVGAAEVRAAIGRHREVGRDSEAGRHSEEGSAP